jgi:hypothetical protein
MGSVLTKEEEKLVDDYGLKMLQNGIKCGIKTDMSKAKEYVEYFYKTVLGVDLPKEIVLIDSPEAAINIVAKSTGQNPKDLVSEVLFLNWWTGWVAYYHAGVNILKEECEKELVDDLNYYETIVNNLHAILPCEKVCFIIEYPELVSLLDGDLEKFTLHNTKDLALKYKDGTGMASINGITVPEYIATTPAKKLDAKQVLGEVDIDVRREGINKIGIAQFVKAIGAKVIHKSKGKKVWENYTLLSTNFGDKERRFLKMVNPSTKDVTLERVADSCQTTQEANAFRMRSKAYIRPIILT